MEDKSNGRKLKRKCFTGDPSVGLAPVPFNAAFPLPETGCGIIYKLQTAANLKLKNDSILGRYFSITYSLQMGLSAGITYLFFLPRFFPRFDNLTPSIILNSGVFIAYTGVLGGSLCPDVGYLPEVDDQPAQKRKTTKSSKNGVSIETLERRKQLPKRKN